MVMMCNYQFDTDVIIISLYAGYVDYAIIVGDMHIQLFSASALQQPQQSRIETAKSFAKRILQTNRDIKKVCQRKHLAENNC